jgi:uncharacterized protein with PIN domain
MVSVKKYGDIKPKEIECDCCNSLLEYCGTDIVTRQVIDHFYGITELKTILCPVCGSLIEVEEDED